MNIKYAVACGIFLTTIACAKVNAPKGWILAGSKPKSYSAAVDKENAYNGQNTVKYQSIEKVANGFGTMMQMIKADQYKGKRVRWSGYIKSEKLDGWAGLWMRVDGVSGGNSLAFDNMQDRAVKGSTAWKKYEVVLDVPAKDSTAIGFGVLLDKNGTIWVSGFELQVVDKKVPVTEINLLRHYPDKPVNLNFE